MLNHISEHGLINLREYKTADGGSPFTTFTDITTSRKNIKDFSYSDFTHGDEFLFLSQDLIYIIAILEILHPRINNLNKENGTYNQTTEDHLYVRYDGFGVQVIYSYWDRIGDLLDLFFQTSLKGDVYLARVLNNFPQAYRSKTFDDLNDLYKTEVEPILSDRHSVVHNFTMKSKFYWGASEWRNDPAKLEALQEEKDSYPSLFRKQLECFFTGFTLAMALISELPEIDYAEEAGPDVTT